MLGIVICRVGVVVIGRNEGERLKRTFGSLDLSERNEGWHHPDSPVPIVYVDSGSSDRSVQLAASYQIRTIELSRDRPFSAARARNEGFANLLELAPEIDFVQFVDGDCSLSDGWLQAAGDFLHWNSSSALVCGQLHEREPNSSPYNRLCELEWRKTPGEIAAAGGIFMVRATAFSAAGGFDPSVIAAEDDEFCLRLRRLGWKLQYIDTPMAIHDADLHSFGQWWKRTERAGYAYAQGYFLHGRTEGHFAREIRRILWWGYILPAVSLAFAWPSRGLSLLLCVLYLLLMGKVFLNCRIRRWTITDSALYAAFTVLANAPMAIGYFRFHLRQYLKAEPKIIEHKRIKKRE